MLIQWLSFYTTQDKKSTQILHKTIGEAIVTKMARYSRAKTTERIGRLNGRRKSVPKDNSERKERLAMCLCGCVRNLHV